MLRIKFFLITLFFLFSTACTNFTRIYKSGSVDAKNFYSEFDYTTKLDLIFIPVEIRGKTYNFLFDTGAPNVISKALHEKLQIKTSGAGKVGDSQGNKNKLEVLKLDSMKIGGIYFFDTGAIVADLKQATEIACLEIDGIVGANLMKLAYWKIDSRNKKMTISSEKDTLLYHLADGHPLPFKTKKTYTPIVNLTINDSLIENITYDTGSAGYITFGKDMKIKTSNLLAEYIGYGNTGLYGANRDTIRFGKITVKQGGVSQVGVGSYSVSTGKKLVGMEYINQFVQILDWEKKEITLYKDDLRKQTFNNFPIIPRWINNQLVIGTLSSDSTIESLGIGVGDSIRAINGLDFQGSDVSAYCNLLFLHDTIKADTLSLEMINGLKHQFSRVCISIE